MNLVRLIVISEKKAENWKAIKSTGGIFLSFVKNAFDQKKEFCSFHEILLQGKNWNLIFGREKSQGKISIGFFAFNGKW